MSYELHFIYFKIGAISSVPCLQISNILTLFQCNIFSVYLYCIELKRLINESLIILLNAYKNFKILDNRRIKEVTYISECIFIINLL